MWSLKSLSCIIGFLFLVACQDSKKIIVTIKNNLDFDRTEIVSIPLTKLNEKSSGNSNWQVAVNEKILDNQLVDLNGDSIHDELIFQVTLPGADELKVTIKPSDEKNDNPKGLTTFSRFVPERTDDYAWENDLVAFRTYGPEAQRLVEQNEKGGTLSSGLDCWLKRVNYPIINNWYKKYTDGGTYHQDDGEGYDPYHVGKSRGCGGIGIWKNDSLYVSKNFISYRKIAEGPLRNIFELTYAPWQADGTLIHETKRITIDLSEQLYQVEEILATDSDVPNVTIGITLHDQKGNVYVDSLQGIFSYWEPIDDSELGTAVVINSESIIGYEDYRTTKKDLSHIYILAKAQSEFKYFTGYAWKKASKIHNAHEWTEYLQKFSKRLNSPLTVTVDED